MNATRLLHMQSAIVAGSIASIHGYHMVQQDTLDKMLTNVSLNNTVCMTYNCTPSTLYTALSTAAS